MHGRPCGIGTNPLCITCKPWVLNRRLCALRLWWLYQSHFPWQVLASLVDSRGAISVPGFYDDVRGGMLDAALARLEATAEFDLASYQAALGIPSFTKDTSKRCARGRLHHGCLVVLCLRCECHLTLLLA